MIFLGNIDLKMFVSVCLAHTVEMVNHFSNTVIFFRYGKIYLKAAKSSIEKGAGYAKKETERLQRMLEKVGILLKSQFSEEKVFFLRKLYI